MVTAKRSNVLPVLINGSRISGEFFSAEMIHACAAILLSLFPKSRCAVNCYWCQGSNGGFHADRNEHPIIFQSHDAEPANRSSFWAATLCEFIESYVDEFLAEELQ